MLATRSIDTEHNPFISHTSLLRIACFPAELSRSMLAAGLVALYADAGDSLRTGVVPGWEDVEEPQRGHRAADERRILSRR